MKFIGMFFSILAAGICLLLINNYYINPEDERTVADKNLDSLVEQQRIKKANEKTREKFKSNGTELFCVKYIEKHHGVILEDYDAIRLTPNFGAISYEVNGKNYHAQCVMKSTSNEVLSFKTELNSV
ncbi:hypothetical protein [uncultured Pseudoalteromonas sp.]|uniref:hypothetical protein n=1 Tax=uncultured Pseudoalteromonas sp. TaxID=114053 RepID=UPI002594FC3C|nr:hypothetical protein [uncultured Pseudoalteromonas sp.]